MGMTRPTLTPIQAALKQWITDGVRREACTLIEYHSEYLGCLPFGCYHWIKCNGNEIDSILDSDWTREDLSALETSGFLIKISETTNAADDSERTVVYSVGVTV